MTFGRVLTQSRPDFDTETVVLIESSVHLIQQHVQYAPSKIPAPSHPLADPDGMVPVEVFDLPPELLTAIRGVPIRPWDTEAPPQTLLAEQQAPSAPRIRPLDAPTFEVDL